MELVKYASGNSGVGGMGRRSSGRGERLTCDLSWLVVVMKLGLRGCNIQGAQESQGILMLGLRVLASIEHV